MAQSPPGAVARPAASDVTSEATDAAAATPAIQFTGVSKTYGSLTALHPIDLEIRDGEFFCLLGPSGCGKSTTLSLVGGFAAPSSGEIRISGELVNQTPPHRRKVNTVFQSYALFPHMNVTENVAFGLKMAKVPRRESETRVAEALHLVALESYADRYPGQLSGGQQQRVAVARALVNRPAVLLLDEPLGALDLQLRKRLQVELAQIQREVGTTFVFVTHDQGEAMTMADRIAVMNEGRIEQIGTAEEIYRRPASRFVADFIGESNFADVEFVDGSVVTVGNGIPLPAPRLTRTGTGTLMVRPECVRLTPASEGDPNLVGTVIKISFLGSVTRASVLCPAIDAPFIVDMPSGLDHDIRENSLVQLRWDVKDTVLLDDPPDDPNHGN
ncbi:MAG TPA: ABC transporter ATP-binding protein [Solirubrobacteraceae bacterium]|nr:ABC transporter ATP-binding protein [Solirubrobacteraceae bacterium]